MPKAAKIKDTDFLSATTRIRSLERGLLGRERMERMLDAKTDEDASKVLVECGYEEIQPLTKQTLEEALAAHQVQTYAMLSKFMPHKILIDVFRVRYDYHNVKALIKAEAIGDNAGKMLIDAGRMPVKQLVENYQNLLFSRLPGKMGDIVLDARELLARTGDPQRSDFLLDGGCLQEMLSLARASGSQFLLGYIRLLIDVGNLRAVVRADRIGKGPDFLRLTLYEGGNIAVSRITGLLISGGSLEDVFSGPLSEAQAIGEPVMRGDAPLTEFEKKCDDALTKYLRKALHVAFGEQPLIAYLAAKDAEITAIRTIMTGRMAGVEIDSIRERLREAYV